MLYSVHSSVYSAHCTVYTLQSTLISIHCICHSLHFTLYTEQCTLYSVHCTVYNMHCYFRKASGPVRGSVWVNQVSEIPGSAAGAQGGLMGHNRHMALGSKIGKFGIRYFVISRGGDCVSILIHGYIKLVRMWYEVTSLLFSVDMSEQRSEGKPGRLELSWFSKHWPYRSELLSSFCHWVKAW